MAQEIDTFNRQMVGLQGDNIVVMMPKPTMTKAEALAHAAWLVVLADPLDEEFPAVRRAIENT